MNRNAAILLKLLPLILPFIFIFSLGIIITVLQSFGIFVFNYRYDDLLFAYKKLFSDDWFLKSFVFSLSVAFFSTLLAVIAGTILSYFVWKLPQNLQNYMIVYKIPLILPHIVVAYFVLVMLSRSGLFSSLLYNIGLIHSQEIFPGIVHGPAGLDIISAYVFKETPFVMLMVISVLNRIDRRQLECASMLGAGRMTVFSRIVFPFIFPVMTTAFIILFVYSFGGFEVPFVLGGNNYPGMVALRVYDIFFRRDLSERPVAMAMLSIIFVFSLLFVYIYSKIISRLSVFERKL